MISSSGLMATTSLFYGIVAYLFLLLLFYLNSLKMMKGEEERIWYVTFFLKYFWKVWVPLKLNLGVQGSFKWAYFFSNSLLFSLFYHTNYCVCNIWYQCRFQKRIDYRAEFKSWAKMKAYTWEFRVHCSPLRQNFTYNNGIVQQV